MGTGSDGCGVISTSGRNFSNRQNVELPRKENFAAKTTVYHCELGGHPVPQAGILLGGDSTTGQLLLSDLLGHVGRIWDHLIGWARQNENGGPILRRSQAMSVRFQEWKSKDRLVD